MPDQVSLLTAANRKSSVSLIVAFVGWLTPAGLAQQFERDIEPIFSVRCIRCHNDRARTSGLSLESQSGILAGGNRGAVVEPGKPDASRLIQAVKQSGDLKMPPDGKLADEQIALLGRWVAAGLPGLKLESASPPSRRGADHWSFQPIVRPSVPTVRNSAWVRNPIDNFVLARLEKEGLSPAPEAYPPRPPRSTSS